MPGKNSVSLIVLNVSTVSADINTLIFGIRWGVGLRERNSHAYRNDAVGQHPFEYWSCHFTARGHPCQVSMRSKLREMCEEIGYETIKG